MLCRTLCGWSRLFFRELQALQRTSNVLLKNQPHTKARQRLAAMIEEDAARLVRRDLTLPQIGTQGVRRLAPQRAAAFLAAFASETNARRCVQRQIACLQTYDFAYPRPSIEQEASRT